MLLEVCELHYYMHVLYIVYPPPSSLKNILHVSFLFSFAGKDAGHAKEALDDHVATGRLPKSNFGTPSSHPRYQE